MNDSHIDTLDEVRQFLGGTDEIDLEIDRKKNRYDFIKRSLMRFKYNCQFSPQPGHFVFT